MARSYLLVTSHGHELILTTLLFTCRPTTSSASIYSSRHLHAHHVCTSRQTHLNYCLINILARASPRDSSNTIGPPSNENRYHEIQTNSLCLTTITPLHPPDQHFRSCIAVRAFHRKQSDIPILANKHTTAPDPAHIYEPLILPGRTDDRHHEHCVRSFTEQLQLRHHG